MVNRLRMPGGRSPSWAVAEGLASAALSLLSLMVVARIIGPQAAGTAVVAISIYLLLDLLVASFFADAMVRHPVLEARHAESAVTAAVALGLLAMLALFLAAPMLARGTGEPALRQILPALALLLPFSAFTGTAMALALRHQQFRLVALRILAGQPIAILVGMAAAWAGLGAWAMVLLQGSIVATAFLLLFTATRPLVRPRLDLAALRELLPTAGPQCAAMLVLQGRQRGFVIGAGMLAIQAVVAQAYLAFRMVEGALSVAWLAASRLSLARLAAVRAEPERLAETYGALAQAQALLGLPLAVGVALVAPEFVRAFLGEAWLGTVTAVQLAAIIHTLTVLMGNPGGLFTVLGTARRNLWLALLSAFIQLAALLLLRPASPVGLALAWSSHCLLVPFLGAWLALRDLHRTPWWLARQVMPAVLATLAMAAAVLSLQRAVALPPLPGLMAAAMLGAGVFATVLWMALGGQWPTALRSQAEPSSIQAAAE